MIELLVVVLIVGILAGVAIPNMRNAAFRGEAAAIVSEANTIRLAAYQHLGDTGRFPRSAGYGSVPAELVDDLPPGYEFSYEGGIQFAWFSFTLPNDDNLWQSRNIGILLVNFSSRPELSQAMRAHQGPDAFWAGNMFYFIYGG